MNKVTREEFALLQTQSNLGNAPPTQRPLIIHPGWKLEWIDVMLSYLRAGCELLVCPWTYEKMQISSWDRHIRRQESILPLP